MPPTSVILFVAFTGAAVALVKEPAVGWLLVAGGSKRWSP